MKRFSEHGWRDSGKRRNDFSQSRKGKKTTKEEKVETIFRMLQYCYFIPDGCLTVSTFDKVLEDLNNIQGRKVNLLRLQNILIILWSFN